MFGHRLDRTAAVEYGRAVARSVELFEDDDRGWCFVDALSSGAQGDSSCALSPSTQGPVSRQKRGGPLMPAPLPGGNSGGMARSRLSGEETYTESSDAESDGESGDANDSGWEPMPEWMMMGLDGPDYTESSDAKQDRGASDSSCAHSPSSQGPASWQNRGGMPPLIPARLPGQNRGDTLEMVHQQLMRAAGQQRVEKEYESTRGMPSLVFAAGKKKKKTKKNKAASSDSDSDGGPPALGSETSSSDSDSDCASSKRKAKKKKGKNPPELIEHST
jgi:hypothetical protein